MALVGRCGPEFNSRLLHSLSSVSHERRQMRPRPVKRAKQPPLRVVARVAFGYERSRPIPEDNHRSRRMPEAATPGERLANRPSRLTGLKQRKNNATYRNHSEVIVMWHGGKVRMVEYTIYCDECKTLLDASGKSAAEARRTAIAGGNMKRYKKQDLCIECFDHITKHSTLAGRGKGRDRRR